MFNDLSKPIEGTFNQSGFVKAMWWADLDNVIPLCAAVGEEITVDNQ